jgi:hypothetical protein
MFERAKMSFRIHISKQPKQGQYSKYASSLGTAVHAASLLASEAAALGANFIITNTSSKERDGNKCPRATWQPANAS